MLLQGPNFTNQIVGVLTRFREEQIALVADIESMFYQVRVPVKQQDMLRFIWWPEGNLDAEPEDYVMVCPFIWWNPSTCNYALRRIAAVNKDQFGEDTASTLIKNASKFIHHPLYNNMGSSQGTVKSSKPQIDESAISSLSKINILPKKKW